MRITGSIVVALLVCTLSAQAQSTREIPLKPIYKHGWKYFYGEQRMNSVYGLQIPLESLNDKEINERFKRFKRFQVYRVIAYLPSLAYLLTNAHFGGHRGYSTRGVDSQTFFLLWAGGLAMDITFNALGHHQMSKAIDIYNVKISNKSTLGLSFNRLLNQNYPGLSYQFKF